MWDLCAATTKWAAQRREMRTHPAVVYATDNPIWASGSESSGTSSLGRSSGGGSGPRVATCRNPPRSTHRMEKYRFTPRRKTQSQPRTPPLPLNRVSPADTSPFISPSRIVYGGSLLSICRNRRAAPPLPAGRPAGGSGASRMVPPRHLLHTATHPSGRLLLGPMPPLGAGPTHCCGRHARAGDGPTGRVISGAI